MTLLLLFFETDAPSFTATGLSFTEVTVRLTVVRFEFNSVSFARKVKLSDPL